MTVSSSTNRVSYSGNGSLTTFAYTFKVFDQDDLTVILRASNGTETVQTITTHYTVTNVGDASGGNIEFVTAPSATETVVIVREQPFTQGLDLVPNDPFPAQSLEESLDKLTFVDQRLNEKIDRALTFSVGDVVTDATLPVKELRVGKVLAFNETTGNPEAGPSIADTESIANISADIATLADIQDGTVATNAITTASSISADISTVSGISSNVTTVAGISANVTTVSGISADVTTVAGISADVTEVAGISTQVTTVANGFDTGNLDFTGTAAISSTLSVGGNIVLEGATANDFETTLTVTDPTADRTITFPDTTGTVVLQQDFTSWSDVSAIDQGLATTDTVAFANVETSGYLRGPSSFTIDPASHGDNTGTVVIAGNLQVDGTTTTINSTTMTVDDTNVTLASGAANAAAAAGAGLYIDGASVVFSYDAVNDRMNLNRDFRVEGRFIARETGGTNHLIEANDTGAATLQLANVTSGTTSTDGFHISYDNTNGAHLRAYSSSIKFFQDTTERLDIAGGYVSVSNGTGFRLEGLTYSTEISRGSITGNRTITLPDKTGTAIVVESNDEALLSDNGGFSSQTATTSSTTQTAIAQFSNSRFNGAKAVITANDGTNTHVTELLIAHDGTTAIATEYGTIYTGSSILATYDVDISGFYVRILTTSASATTTTYSTVLTIT